MHIQIVNFTLKEMTHQEFLEACDQLAPAFAAIPGLQSKVWLSDQANNTYGGVYTWRDRKAMADYMQTDLFKTVASHPNFANMTAKEFDILEGPTKATRG